MALSCASSGQLFRPAAIVSRLRSRCPLASRSSADCRTSSALGRAGAGAGGGATTAGIDGAARFAAGGADGGTVVPAVAADAPTAESGGGTPARRVVATRAITTVSATIAAAPAIQYSVPIVNREPPPAGVGSVAGTTAGEAVGDGAAAAPVTAPHVKTVAVVLAVDSDG